MAAIGGGTRGQKGLVVELVLMERGCGRTDGQREGWCSK